MLILNMECPLNTIFLQEQLTFKCVSFKPVSYKSKWDFNGIFLPGYNGGPFYLMGIGLLKNILMDYFSPL